MCNFPLQKLWIVDFSFVIEAYFEVVCVSCIWVPFDKRKNRKEKKLLWDLLGASC